MRKHPAHRRTCKGPARLGDTRRTYCGKAASYWGDKARTIPLCASHYQQERRGFPLSPLESRKVAKSVGVCTGPGHDGAPCGRIGNYTKSGKPLCDTHQKQWERAGTLWAPTKSRRRPEAA